MRKSVATEQQNMNAMQILIKRFPPVKKHKHLIWLNVLRSYLML